MRKLVYFVGSIGLAALAGIILSFFFKTPTSVLVFWIAFIFVLSVIALYAKLDQIQKAVEDQNELLDELLDEILAYDPGNEDDT